MRTCSYSIIHCLFAHAHTYMYKHYAHTVHVHAVHVVHGVHGVHATITTTHIHKHACMHMWTLNQGHTHECQQRFAPVSTESPPHTHLFYIGEWSLGTRSRAHITELLFATHVHVLKGWTVIRSYTHHFVGQYLESYGYLITEYTTYQLVEECEWHHVHFTAYWPKVWSWRTLLEKAMLQCIIFLKVLSRVWKYTQVSHRPLTEQNVHTWHAWEGCRRA